MNRARMMELADAIEKREPLGRITREEAVAAIRRMAGKRGTK